MSYSDRRLAKEITIVIIIKIILITVLWWMFIRDVQVPVNTDHMANQLTTQTHQQPKLTNNKNSLHPESH